MPAPNSPTNRGRLMHDVAEAITLLDALTYLAIQETPESEPARQHLYNLRATIARLIARMRRPKPSVHRSPEQIQDEDDGFIEEAQVMSPECLKVLKHPSTGHRDKLRLDDTT